MDAMMKKYVHPLYALRDRMKGYEVAIMKDAMEILGHPAGPVRPPLANVTPADRADLEKLMAVYADVV
jgi:5-dehydro-4-deoxyglucarate dehydratase